MSLVSAANKSPPRSPAKNEMTFGRRLGNLVGFIAIALGVITTLVWAAFLAWEAATAVRLAADAVL